MPELKETITRIRAWSAELRTPGVPMAEDYFEPYWPKGMTWSSVIVADAPTTTCDSSTNAPTVSDPATKLRQSPTGHECNTVDAAEPMSSSTPMETPPPAPVSKDPSSTEMIPVSLSSPTPAASGRELEHCPRCDGYVYSPVHMLGIIGQYYGGRSAWPDMRWCTPDGFVVLPFVERPEW